MQTIEKNGWIFEIRDSGEAVLTECERGAPILALPGWVDGHPLTGVEYDAFDHAGTVEAFQTEANHPALTAVNGVLFDQGRQRLLRYPMDRRGEEYIVPAGTREIAFGAFAGARELKRVTLPEGVAAIEGRAFADCPALTKVQLPGSIASFGHEVFSGSPLLRDVDVPEDHPFLSREGCFLVDRKESILLCCLPGGGETALTAPEDLRFVDEYAFHGCVKLQKIHFHHGLRSLGRYAFYHCSALKTVELPANLRSIGTRAFSGCTELRSLYIPESVTSIEYKAFNNCDKLVLQVDKGSYADRYCRQFGFPCRHRVQWPWMRS